MLIVPTYEGDLVVAGTDPLAVDLVALAFADPKDAPGALGPWQHPLVQRAAELGLGVPGPHALTVDTYGERRASGGADLGRLADAALLRLGIAAAGTSAERQP